MSSVDYLDGRWLLVVSIDGRFSDPLIVETVRPSALLSDRR